jgi:tetratricopeptide (TPR) repeat protein
MLLEEDPIDEDVLCSLMELLHRHGMTYQALRYYQAFLEVAEREGLEPTEAIKKLATQLATCQKSTPLDAFSPSFSLIEGQNRAISPQGRQAETHVVEATSSPLFDDQEFLPLTEKPSEHAGPLLAETRHLLGRQEWLASVIALIQAEIPKKLLVLHGPIGVGKSSELNRLAHSFVKQNVSPAQVIVLSLPAREPRDPEASLDLFVGMLLSSSRAASFPADSSRQIRIKVALTALAQRPEPTVILLDNAEGTLTEEGTLAPCWEAFLTSVVRGQHQATLVLATKEWPGWTGRDPQLVAEVSVPALTLEDSVLLLQRLGLESVPLAELETISQRVACIPLCLEWIAKIVHDPLVHDAWESFEEPEETSTESRLDAVAQRLARLLDHPTLLGEHLASRLTPLLEHIIDRHLSADARRVLEHLALVAIPLAKPALQVLCPRPALLKELRDASLLAAYTNRVQLLPMVSSTVRLQLLPEHVCAMEELTIQAFISWLDEGNMSTSEAGSLVTELAILLLTHHRLLDAAQLLIRFGGFSFKIGGGQLLAQLAEKVMQQFDWQTSLSTWCGGKILYYTLTPFLGKKINVQQRAQDYQTIRDAIVVGKIVLRASIEVMLTHYIMLYALNELHFEEAQAALDACSCRLEPLLTADVGLHAALLAKRGMLLNRWCEYAEERGEKESARRRREQAIILYRHSEQLLSTYAESSPLQRSKLKRQQAYALNYLGYHLYRMGRYEEALQALQQSTTLQEKGYGALDGLAPCYGDTSQTLMALGRFQEALWFDEKAYAETLRLAETGHALSKEEIWVYRVNRGCLYLRLGRIDEAEHMLREALHHIPVYRRMYCMFAKEALDEIEQWRRSSTSPQHQLDWRWVERYRSLVAYDTYWWLGSAGPLTEEEQREWDQSFPRQRDEDAKQHLSKLMAQSTRREVYAALDERREPRLHYPAIDIEEVRSRISDLLQLDEDISREEPNAIVRRLYHETLEEERETLRLIEATYEGNSEHFQTSMYRLIPPPTPAEMQYALSRVRREIIRGLARPETQQASERLVQILHEQYGLSFDLSYTEGEAQEVFTAVSPPSSQPEPKVTPQATKRFFETIFQETGFDGWQVVIDPNATSARVEQGLRCLFLVNNSVSVKQIKHLLLHELAGHAMRCLAGEHSLLGILGIHTKNSLETEEGLAIYYDIQEAMQRGEKSYETRVWPGTLATGFASGVVTPPQTFLSLFTFFEAFFFLRRLLQGLDPDEETARKRAQQLAITNCLRTYRGVPDLERAGVCFTQDALYLRGLRTIERALAEDKNVLNRLAVGVVGVEQLPDLRELGIEHVPQPLRILAENPELDAYIVSFGQTEKTIFQAEERNML